VRLTPKERRALRIFEKPVDQRDYGDIHGNTIQALERKKLITSSHQLTKAGRTELKVPNIFDDVFETRKSEPKRCDPDRALAAAEVLETVWLNDFELECKVDDPPIVETDDEDHVWISVKIHVPALDVDTWLDGTWSAPSRRQAAPRPSRWSALRSSGQPRRRSICPAPRTTRCEEVVGESIVPVSVRLPSTTHNKGVRR
jgi:hypothetical protein